MRLTVVFEGNRMLEGGTPGRHSARIAKNEQGTLFYDGGTGFFYPIDSYDLRVVNGEKYLVGTQPFAQDMPIT
jgi:hypothetical protein